MIEQTATVLAVADGAALIEVPRVSSCSACGKGSQCGTSLIARLFGTNGSTRLRVRDPLGVQPGERVVVGIQDSLLVQASLVAYLLPLPFLIIGAALGEQAGWGDPGSVLTGLLGLAAGLLLSGLITGGSGARARFRPRLLRRVGQSVPLRCAPAHPSVGG